MGSIEKQTIYGKNNMKLIKILCLLVPILLLIGCSGAVSPEPTTTAAPATAPVVFDIYAVNDLHGRLTVTDTQPGVAGLSTYLRQRENALLLATGDMWKGTAASDLTKGQLVTEWMNALGFAAMTLGGHEYDWGEAGIRGSDMVAKFLETDDGAYHIALTDYGKSLRESIDPEGIYYVVTDSYSADYAPNRLTVIDTYERGVYARDLLAAYFSESDQ